MRYLLFISIILATISCQQQQEPTTIVVNQDGLIDSLKQISMDKDIQMNSLVATLLEVDDNLQKIKEKENLITLNVANNEAGGEALEKRINRDIKVIYELMVQNKEQISKLEAQLANSSTNNTNLSKLVKRLNSQLKTKTVEIIKLQKKLESQSLQIADLNFTIEGLQLVVDSLEGVKHATQQELNETIEKLYRAYYVFGTKKELRNEGILSSDGFLKKSKLLSEGFSQDYFSTIDYRELDSLNLYMPKAKVLSNHPSSSYTMELGSNGAMLMKITDKENFWSMSRHLVVQVSK
ncbi:hypothetical protein [Carboxylicivirga sp. M1479]|uniref:Cbp1 family collagen-binding glycoprotein adhesin n=1 Tax=Carboxylicivirga sp. M1479 TaxID=2594476 RepID=UPI00117809E7|nr:hypothetical protein [Carboxylicivirga sp. M1479]TRX70230.1 hypothetical protein FNN09_12145 [Carboxylicivirga sp. M1479]